MTYTIETELKNYILDCINDGILTNDNIDDWHFHAFNEDYYIIYHSRAIEWLKEHNLNTFEAIDIVKEYEVNHFGEFTTDINPESIVNMLAYIYGEEVLYSYDVETVEELESFILNDLSTFDEEVEKTNKDFVFFNVDEFGTITESVFTNDYNRYKNNYDKFLSIEKARNIDINI